jgi:hypothetical protein
VGRVKKQRKNVAEKALFLVWIWGRDKKMVI